MCLSSCSGSLPILSKIGVSVGPGLRVLTLISFSKNSDENDLDKERIPAFVAP